MTDRSELDAWIEQADEVLDYNEYGLTWEADAMHCRQGRAVEAADDRGVIYSEALTRPEDIAEALLAVFRALGEIVNDGIRALVAWAESVRPTLDQIANETEPAVAQETFRRSLTVLVRQCPTHGQEMAHGQCRLCQRAANKASRRRG